MKNKWTKTRKRENAYYTARMGGFTYYVLKVYGNPEKPYARAFCCVVSAATGPSGDLGDSYCRDVPGLIEAWKRAHASTDDIANDTLERETRTAQACKACGRKKPLWMSTCPETGDVHGPAVQARPDIAPADSPQKSYRVFVIMPDGERVGNGLRFAQRIEADAYGVDLLSRWFAPESYEIEECTDIPTHAFLLSTRTLVDMPGGAKW